MYNGIGLQTARGSGTNGFVQRNLSFVRRHKDKVDYKSEEELKKLDSLLTKAPNQEILQHARKRKVELKCMEMHELMQDQGYSAEEIEKKVSTFRNMLLAKEGVSSELDKEDKSIPKDSHRIAESQQAKSNQFKAALGISDFFVEGSSLDPNRKAKEDNAIAVAMAQKKYAILKDEEEGEEEEEESASPSPERKRKKKKHRSDSGSSDQHYKKRKKSRKHRHRHDDSDEDERRGKKKRSRHHSSRCGAEEKKKAIRVSDSSTGSDNDSDDKGSGDEEVVSSRQLHSPKKLCHNGHQQSLPVTRSPPPHHKHRSRSGSYSQGHRRDHSESPHRSRRDSHRSRNSSYDSYSSLSPPRRDKLRRSRSPSIRRRKGSPSHLDRRRITRSVSRSPRRAQGGSRRQRSRSVSPHHSRRSRPSPHRDFRR